MLWILIASASAQAPFTLEAFPVLDETSDPLVANGLGSPTVAWDPDQQRYMMFFETRTGAPVAGDCPAGQWSIGVASSEDGLAWEIWPDPVIEPTAGTPYRCVAAHPTVLFEDGVFHLWFKAEQGVVPAACGFNWGCANYTGVGYATVDPQLDDKTDEIAATEVLIAGLEQDRLDAMDDFEALVTQYQADLVQYQDAFACVDALPICTPCETFDFTATMTTTTEQEFCQRFRFELPQEIPFTGSTAYHVATLQYRNGNGQIITCAYTSQTIPIPGFPGSSAPYQFSSCVRNGNVLMLAPGDIVGADWAKLSLALPPVDTTAMALTLAATNAGSQNIRGALPGEIVEMLNDLGTQDFVATEQDLPALIAELQETLAWLDDFPADADRTLLALGTIELINAAQLLLGELDSTADQIADHEAALAVLEAYVTYVDSDPIPNVALALPGTFGYPNVAKLDGQYVMLLQEYPNIKRAVGATPDSFVLDATPVMSAGVVSWATTEVFEPAMACTGDAMMPLETWVGGRRVVAGAITEAGLSDTVSDGVSWLFNAVATQVPASVLGAFGWTWSGPDLYRHFDVIRSDDGSTRMFYSQRVGGFVRIGVMKDTPDPWDDAASTNRSCD